jgi:hypothetical protein
MDIPASFPLFPQRPFVFRDIPASFVQKKEFFFRGGVPGMSRPAAAGQ